MPRTSHEAKPGIIALISFFQHASSLIGRDVLLYAVSHVTIVKMSKNTFFYFNFRQDEYIRFSPETETRAIARRIAVLKRLETCILDAEVLISQARLDESGLSSLNMAHC